MTPAALIKQARMNKGWTQAQLAEAIGVTAGFITKLEAEQALPGYERCLALASVLDLPLDELWADVEQARAAMFQQRIRTRGAAVRGAIRTRGAAGLPPERPASELSAEEIAREIIADPDLQTAYHDLRTALADPRMRDTVLNALRAFARAVHHTSDR